MAETGARVLLVRVGWAAGVVGEGARMREKLRGWGRHGLGQLQRRRRRWLREQQQGRLQRGRRGNGVGGRGGDSWNGADTENRRRGHVGRWWQRQQGPVREVVKAAEMLPGPWVVVLPPPWAPSGRARARATPGPAAAAGAAQKLGHGGCQSGGRRCAWRRRPGWPGGVGQAPQMPRRGR